MLFWKTVNDVEFALVDKRNSKVYVRILKDGIYYIILYPNGTKTNNVYLELDTAKTECETIYVPFELSRYKKVSPE